MRPIDSAATDTHTADATAAYRILDANRNRCLEGLRVAEDYVRFVWNDQHLVRLCKELRHELVSILSHLPQACLHSARDTLGDVGTSVTTPSEYQRVNTEAVLAANWSRVQQSLRCLEEYSKTVAPQVSPALEALRYRTYTLERAMTTLAASATRLASAQLYVLIDGRSSEAEFRAEVTTLLEAGVDVLQLRDKKLSERELLARGHLLRELTRERGVLCIMNDRVDLAAMVRADGVHLGQDDLPLPEARMVLGCQALIGISTHTLPQAQAAVLAGADYIGCGPTFPSATKSFEAFPGLDFLRQVQSEIQLPAFAIGGIGPDNVARVVEAGFRRVAVSHSVVGAADPAWAARSLKTALPSAPPRPGPLCQ
jgi:thiamine-phosphate pyrophosphorylase